MFYNKLSILFIPVLLFSIKGCQKNKEEVHVWCTSSYEKVPAEADFSSHYNDKTFSLSLVKNEIEAAQIVISSPSNEEYKITLSDLRDDSGNVLSKEYFNVYHEKMITLENKYDYLSPLVIGDFPDALLPYQKAVEYHENVVKSKQNQPVWINLKVPAEQKAGTYKGEFKVEVGGTSFAVPASVKVYNYTLSNVTHSESSFVLRDSNILLTEMDSSEEMLKKYYDFFLDHRLSTNFPFELTHSSYNDDLSYFFKYAKEYSLDDRCSLYNIPYYQLFQNVEIDNDGYLAIGDKRATNPESRRMAEIAGYDWDRLLVVLEKMVEESLKDGIDLFKKATFAGTIFDEFTNDTSNGYMALNKAVYNIRRLDDIALHIAETIDYLTYSGNEIKQSKTLSFDANNDNGGVGYSLTNLGSEKVIETSLSEAEFNEFKFQLKNSIIDTYCYVTCTYAPAEFFFNNVPRCALCYIANLYDAQENVTKVQNLVKEKGWKAWVYTCVMPKYPYATYHIDDMLISSRLLGWQMFDYNLVGNLFWGSAIASVVDNEISYNQIPNQDFYQTANRYPHANGDGYLVYPGREYGIYGPLSSIRLESILDGNEDYDLFFALKELLGETEYNKVKSELTSNLYDGMVISYEDGYLNNFKVKREALCSMLEQVANKA